MNNIALFTIVLGTMISCNTTQQNDSQLSGATSYQIFQSITGSNTPEEKIQALTERLDVLNQYTNSGLAATIGNCPIGRGDPCSMVNILIEFETPGSGSVGHTAISVSDPQGVEDSNIADRNDQFFDFGPGKEYYIDTKGTETQDDDEKIPVKVGQPGVYALPPGSFNGLFSGVPGTQWWDNPWRFSDSSLVAPSSIGLREIIEDIDRLADDYTVIRVPICMTKEHALMISKWWVKAYTDMPTYRIPGSHCTSMVANSIEQTAAGAKELISGGGKDSASIFSKYILDPRTIDRYVTSPTKYAKRVLGGDYNSAVDYRHQCGDLKGQNPRAIMMRNNTIFNDEKIMPRVKWQEDRSIP